MLKRCIGLAGLFAFWILFGSEYTLGQGDELRFSEVHRTGSNMTLTVSYPTNWIHRLDIYCSDDPLSGGWIREAALLNPTGETSIVWTDETNPDQQATYAIGNADFDGDQDALSDSSEILLYHTSPTNQDTDGDQLPDGAEVNIANTSPLIGTDLDASSIFELIATWYFFPSNVLVGMTTVQGKDYRVDGSADLLNWQNASPTFNGIEGAMQVVINNAPSFQYYRGVVSPPGFGPLAGGVTQIVSRNATANITLKCPRGKRVLAGLPLRYLDGRTVYAQDLLGNQLPVGSEVAVWNSLTDSYLTDTNKPSGWTQQVEFTPGVGFEIFVPTSASAECYDLFLMGELPDIFTAPAGLTTINLVSAPSLVAYPYPYEIFWTNTTLAQNASTSATQVYWDATSESLRTNINSVTGWSEADLILTPASAFWFSENATWISPKPYAWP